MGREPVKLSTEKHGKGIRYKRMFRGQVWKSEAYPHETRENKRTAWQAFVRWRDEQRNRPATPQNDSTGLLQELLATKVQALIDHAELTANPTEAIHWRKVLTAVPKLDDKRLFGLTALLIGEYNGEDFTPIIEDREMTVSRIKNATVPELTAGSLAGEYIERLRRKAEAGRGSCGHYGQVKVAVNLFVEWYGAGRSLEHLNEKTIRDFNSLLEDRIDKGALSRSTAHGYQKVFRTWLGQTVENYPDDIPLPKNLHSKSQRIVTERKEPGSFTIDEMKLLLSHAVPRMKLFLMLMLNCAMYQGDIADLTASEVDWKAGRIIRPRSKTARQALNAGKNQPFKFNWLLWRDTWKLFQKIANTDGLCFRSANGGALITHKPTTRNDAIRSAYARLVRKLKHHKLLPADWNKTLKGFRKTGANLLEKSKEHGEFYSLYLNHSVARQNYLTSGEPVPSFDAAIKWLGQQLGIK
jgi:integrase